MAPVETAAEAYTRLRPATPLHHPGPISSSLAGTTSP
jgi:hypothetical protein